MTAIQEHGTTGRLFSMICVSPVGKFTILFPWIFSRWLEKRHSNIWRNIFKSQLHVDFPWFLEWHSGFYFL